MRYRIIELSGYERECSKFEYYATLTFFYFFMIVTVLSFGRVLFEMIRGY